MRTKYKIVNRLYLIQLWFRFWIHSNIYRLFAIKLINCYVCEFYFMKCSVQIIFIYTLILLLRSAKIKSYVFLDSKTFKKITDFVLVVSSKYVHDSRRSSHLFTHTDWTLSGFLLIRINESFLIIFILCFHLINFG